MQVWVLAAFWPLKSNLWSGADCKFAGFTPSVVRSTPTQAILQVFKQFGGQLGISSLIGFDVVGKGPVALEPGAQRAPGVA